jgi:hypothetical protein
MALPDFLRSSGSETGSTQPRKDNWRAIWKDSSGFGLENRINGRRDSLRWPRDTLYPLKLTLTSPTSGSRSVGIVRACGLKPRSLSVFVCDPLFGITKKVKSRLILFEWVWYQETQQLHRDSCMAGKKPPSCHYTELFISPWNILKIYNKYTTQRILNFITLK